MTSGPMTQEEISGYFKITKMRVCQLEQLAMVKLNKRLRSSNLIYFIIFMYTIDGHGEHYMSELASEVLGRVLSKEEAKEVVSGLLIAFADEKAFQKIKRKSNKTKQSVHESTRRLVSNLFTSLSTSK